MMKLSMLAGVAIAAIGVATLSTGAANAACLHTNLPPISLSQNVMVPEAGFGYDKAAYDAEAAQGNFCGPIQQSYRVPSNPGGTSNPDEPTPNATDGMQYQQ